MSCPCSRDNGVSSIRPHKRVGGNSKCVQKLYTFSWEAPAVLKFLHPHTCRRDPDTRTEEGLPGDNHLLFVSVHLQSQNFQSNRFQFCEVRVEWDRATRTKHDPVLVQPLNDIFTACSLFGHLFGLRGNMLVSVACCRKERRFADSGLHRKGSPRGCFHARAALA